ncbi:MAG: hypothetical protein OEW66_10875 [Actinomycetota bacterium]|nr:hypothetical protein [Actinomycetota bacterium]MDH5314321.1 hypothetical protein [Actinomycetota bacterium]
MDTTQIERRIVGAVRGEEVDIRDSGVGAASSSGDLFLTNAGAGALASRGNLTITNGGGGPMAIGGDVSITNGGAQTIVAAGGATLGERSFVAFVLSPKVTVEPGARVLCSTRQALAFGAVVSAAMLAAARMMRGSSRN